MIMITDMYQEYLFVIGKLKDIHNLTIDVEHKDIHTFYRDKRPLFKLFHGVFSNDNTPSIVVSFHIDMHHAEAIQWYIAIYKIHPLLRLHDSYIEDSNGETYLGEDALAIREVYMTQQILDKWLSNHSEEEIKEFVDSKVVGREKDPKKTFNSQSQMQEAIIEFDRMVKPTEDDEVH